MSNDVDLVPELRSAWLHYLRRVDSTRSELHRMCRERTASIWAAEALLQQALADGFASLARENDEIVDWAGYLREQVAGASPKHAPYPLAAERLVDRFVHAMNEGNAAALAVLLADDFRARVFPFPIGKGKQQALCDEGWIGVSLRERGGRRVERMTYQSEPLVVVWSGARAHELWRLHGRGERISALDDYVACPETQLEVAAGLGLGDRFHAQSCLRFI